MSLRRRDERKNQTKQMKEQTITPLVKLAATHTEAVLKMANDIVGRVMHEDFHDNPQMVIGVMLAMMLENSVGLAIREGLDDIASAIREGSMH